MVIYHQPPLNHHFTSISQPFHHQLTINAAPSATLTFQLQELPASLSSALPTFMETLGVSAPGEKPPGLGAPWGGWGHLLGVFLLGIPENPGIIPNPEKIEEKSLCLSYGYGL